MKINIQSYFAFAILVLLVFQQKVISIEFIIDPVIIDADMPTSMEVSPKDIHFGDIVSINIKQTNNSQEKITKDYWPYFRENSTLRFYVTCPEVEGVYVWRATRLSTIKTTIEIAPGDTKTIYRDILEFPPLLEIETEFWHQIAHGEKDFYNCTIHAIVTETSSSKPRIEFIDTVCVRKRSDTEMKMLVDWVADYKKAYTDSKPNIGISEAGDLSVLKSMDNKSLTTGRPFRDYPFENAVSKGKYPFLYNYEKWKGIENSLTPGTLRDMFSMISEIKTLESCITPETEETQIQSIIKKMETFPCEFRNCLVSHIDKNIEACHIVKLVNLQQGNPYPDRKKLTFELTPENVDLYYELTKDILPEERKASKDLWEGIKNRQRK